MSKVIVTINIGNSTISLCCFQDDDLVCYRSIDAKHNLSMDDIHNFLNEQNMQCVNANHIALSSVNLNRLSEFLNYFRRQATINPIVLTYTDAFNLNINYLHPETLGMDRVCNAVAGIERYGAPLIVVDVGTATTFEVVDSKNNFIGGAIMPGPITQFNSLHNNTAQLPQVNFKLPESTIGKSTSEGIKSGVILGSIEAIEGIIRRIKQELNCSPKVVMTGGLGGIFSRLCPNVDNYDEHLTHWGAKFMAEHKSNINVQQR